MESSNKKYYQAYAIARALYTLIYVGSRKMSPEVYTCIVQGVKMSQGTLAEEPQLSGVVEFSHELSLVLQKNNWKDIFLTFILEALQGREVIITEEQKKSLIRHLAKVRDTLQSKMLL